MRVRQVEVVDGPRGVYRFGCALAANRSPNKSTGMRRLLRTSESAESVRGIEAADSVLV
jgi:hypothetical protein